MSSVLSCSIPTQTGGNIFLIDPKALNHIFHCIPGVGESNFGNSFIVKSTKNLMASIIFPFFIYSITLGPSPGTGSGSNVTPK
jgi:hypothetical protein